MEQMDLIEKIREKTGCSYSEARAALEESGGSLLDALCWLETHGKTQLTGASCSTEGRPAQEPEPEPECREPGAFQRGMRALRDALVRLLRAGNRNELVMHGKSGSREFGIPVTLFVVLLVLGFWVVAILMVVALFCGCKFSFEGPDLGTEKINDAMGKATEYADQIKQEFQDET